MKKNPEKLWTLFRSIHASKILLIMRIMVFLLLLGVIQVSGEDSYSQNAKVSLNMTDVTIGQVLNTIENQSDFYFIFNQKLVDINRKVNIHASEESIDRVLNQLFQGTDIRHMVLDRQIVLSPKPLLASTRKEAKRLQQMLTVTGTVTDEKGAPLPGVNILEKGTTNGAITDVNGKYSLRVTPNATLVFSFVGYKKQEIPVAGKTVVNVKLIEEAYGLGEVVTIGYGTRTKRDINSSVSQITNESFNQSNNSSISELIVGKAAGVQVVRNSGEPGAGFSIDVRGVGSINARSAPLYVVDGLPIDDIPLITGTGNQVAATRSPRNPISFLNPEDIQSIEILKDASATAIYGARGANGVIMITTKTGAEGKLKIDYNGQYGINKVHKRLDLLDPQEYMDGINYLIDHGTGSEEERVTEIQDGGTDWQDVIFRENALTQDHNLSFSWGNRNTNYLVSLNQNREEGLVKNTSFTRYAGRFNLTHDTKKFKFGVNSTSSYIKDIYVPNGFDVNLRGGVINAAKLYDPSLAVKDADGNYVTSEFMDIDNPQAIIYGNHMKGNRYRYLGTVYGEYFFIPSLSAKVRLGGDVNNENKTVYKDRTTIIGNSLGGVATAYSAVYTNYLVEGLLNYNKKFGDHNISALGGVTMQEFMSSYSEQQANNFTTDATLAYNFGLADRSTLVDYSYKTANTLLSYLGRVQYNYANKYLITATLRIDGSSRFGEGNKYGYFPSFAAGWSIDQEDFFPWKNFFDMLKLRVSWGQTGNQEIGNYAAITTFSTGRRTSYVLNDQFVTSLNPSRIANPNLRWETTEQIDVGVDFAFLDRRISGTIDWYRKDTKDMLLNLPVPLSTGFQSIKTNIGKMHNSGLEFSLKTFNVSGHDFSWNSDLNFYTLKNEVDDLGGIPQILTGGFSAAPGTVSIIVPGQPLRSFYGYEVVGVWQEGDDFSTISNDVAPGDLKFKDVNGDGTIDGDDRVILGNSFPSFSWGFGNSFKYKGLELYVFFKGVSGVSMINGNLLEQYYPRSGVRINRFSEPFLNRWTPENPTNDQPSYLNLNQHAQSINSLTVVDASYVKLQTVSLSYTLPSAFVKSIKLRNAEVYVSGVNLITFSDYDGFDPALNPNGSANFRIDWNGYPSARTFLFGVRLGF